MLLRNRILSRKNWFAVFIALYIGTDRPEYTIDPAQKPQKLAFDQGLHGLPLNSF